MGRVVLGGLLAGVVVFFWGAHRPHGASPRDDRHPANYPTRMESSLRFAARSPRRAFTSSLAWTTASQPRNRKRKRSIAKIKQGPAGILVIHPEGGEAMSPRQLGTELATNVVCALYWRHGC